MLTWPHRQGDWASHMDQVEPVYVRLASEISRREKVLIVCLDDDHRTHVHDRLRAEGISDRQIDLRTARSNDSWARDHGPITVKIDGQLRLLDFRFNGWGGKYPAELDNAIVARLHEDGAFGGVLRDPIDMVLEGGSIDVDGAGTLLTTARCLMSPTRNPELGQQQLEQRLRELLGVHRILWLRHGGLSGDDTDGHIDLLARFCNETTIAHTTCGSTDAEQWTELKAMERELAALRTADGGRYTLVPLPCPRPLYSETGKPLPATYANFLVINGAVLVPVYDDPADEEAVTRLAACLPGREIISIDSRPLIEQHGSIHCLAMHFPEGVLAP